ncbi:MAG: N-acetyltransferase family protein [Dehalococcoidia bacterium]
MGLASLIDKVFAGGLGRLEEQNAAQHVDLAPLPAEISIAGEQVALRPVEAGDRDALLAFARSLPEYDLAFLLVDITKPEGVDDWLREVAAGRYATLVACAGPEIVGSATVAASDMPWKRHVAELRMMLVPRMRGKGLGRLLAQQSFAIAEERGIRKMTAHMTTDQEAAIHTFEKMGFEREAVLRGEVKDADGRLHDLQIMALDADQFRTRLAVARNASTSSGIV